MVVDHLVYEANLHQQVTDEEKNFFDIDDRKCVFHVVCVLASVLVVALSN